MNLNGRLSAFLGVCLACLWVDVSTVSAAVRLPKIFGNQMVLQRELPVRVWGWAEPDEEVTVKIGNDAAKAKADAEGQWRVELPSQKSGEPLTMTVSGENTITLADILVGEVWVCSGQSNMEWTITRSDNPDQEIAAANYPSIRLFHIPKVPASSPQTDVNAAWATCTPQSVPNFSAVAYFFGRHLHQELNVPVGIIETAWGGTRIEPWTPPEGFKAVPPVASILDGIESQREQYAQQKVAALKGYAEWLPKAQDAAAAGRPIPDPPGWPADPIANPGAPTGLYNGMVHAIVPFAIRGAIWYQGESNLGEGMLYYEKMKALIGGWRTVWDQGEFPFLFVQLAPFRYNSSPTALPEIWEAQLAAVGGIPNTGMAVITDIGNITDIHPKNKQDVGKRLALWALAKTYGRDDLVYSGPLYESTKVEGGAIRIRFRHSAGGLKSSDGQSLTDFTIAGADGQFVEAKAEIDGETLLVSSDAVPEPKAVRFGWQQEAEPNLVNSADLPASPFRTDGPTQ